MSAVVKNDEDTQAKHSGEEHKHQCKPVRNFEAAIGEIPQDEIRCDAVEHLPEAAPQVGILVAGDSLLPRYLLRFGWHFALNGFYSHADFVPLS